MFTKPCLKKIVMLLLIAVSNYFYAQSPYSYSITTTPDGCFKGTSRLEITGTIPADTVIVEWSAGYTDTRIIYDLISGNYFVHVKIKHKTDTSTLVKDTVLTYFIDKEECTVSFAKYFSPNGDNYNDLLSIANIDKYPDFELNIYDRWGQRVHHQRSSYIPWDGTWLGINLPDGTYYYVFFYNVSNRGKLVKGDVTIIR